MQYAFRLTFKLPHSDASASQLLSALGEAGCKDAQLGSGVAGHIALEFNREAASATTAIVSALADVKKAMPRLKLVEAGPDLVGLREVAKLAGVSRQFMHKMLLARTAESSPTPVHSGNSVIWHLADVLDFLVERSYDIPPQMLEVARTTMQVNIVKERALLDAQLERQVEPLVA